MSTLCTCSLFIKKWVKKRVLLNICILSIIHTLYCRNIKSTMEVSSCCFEVINYSFSTAVHPHHCSYSAPAKPGHITRLYLVSFITLRQVLTKKITAGDTDFSCPWAQTHSQSHSVNNLNESVVNVTSPPWYARGTQTVNHTRLWSSLLPGCVKNIMAVYCYNKSHNFSTIKFY